MKHSCILVAAASVLLLSGCGQSLKWQKIVVDGSRTGVVPSNADNVRQAMGFANSNFYQAPNGRSFENGCVPEVAAIVIGAQPGMHELKQVIGYATRPMSKNRPESELSNWFADLFIKQAAREFCSDVDVSFLNFGGIRTAFSGGDILLDDVVSMFPFNNYLTYVCIKGSNLRKLFEQMAENGPQVVGGVKVKVRDGKLADLEVGGAPVDDNRTYGLATIDFLLEGGDGYNIASLAENILRSGVKVMDAVIAEVKELTAAGKPVEYSIDGRMDYEK